MTGPKKPDPQDPSDPWTKDGTVDLDYVTVAHPDFSPANLDFMLNLAGVKSPFDGDFTMLELGAGQMLSSASFCLTAPLGRYLALDYLPKHVKTGTFLKSCANLSLEVSGQGFAEFSGPAAQAIALHGVWTWITDEARQHLIRILGQSLDAGGVAYVSYNALPGWAQMRPVRDLFKYLVDRALGPLEGRIEQALAELARLVEGGGWFDNNPEAADLVEKITAKDPHYLAHEYLNANWRPFYPFEVADDLAKAGLTRVGSASAMDHMPYWRFGTRAERVLAASDNADLAQMVLDPALFRRDLFVKDPVYLTEQERQAQLAQKQIALIVPLELVPYSVTTPQGIRPLDGDFARHFQSPAALGAVAAKTGLTLDEVLQKVLPLLELGLALPTFGAIAAQSAQKFNEALWQLQDQGHSLRQILAPSLGVMVPFSRFDWQDWAAKSRTWPHLGL